MLNRQLGSTARQVSPGGGDGGTSRSRSTSPHVVDMTQHVLASGGRPRSPLRADMTTPLLPSTAARGPDGRYYTTLPGQQQQEQERPASASSEGSEPTVAEKKEAAVAAPKTGAASAWLRLFRMAQPEYKMLGGAVGLLFVSSGVSMAIPFSMGKIIDMVTSAGAAIPFGLSPAQAFGGLAAVFAVGALANAGRIFLIRTAGERMIARLRRELFGGVVRQDMAFFDSSRTGDLVSRLSTDTAVVSKSITNNVSDGLRAAISAVAGVAMMVVVSPKLTGVMLGIIPPVALWGVVYGRFVRRLSRDTQQAVGALSKVAEERLGNVRTVQAFSGERAEVARFDGEAQRILGLARREAAASALFFGGNGLAGNLAVVAFLALGGRMVLRGEISVGDMASVMMYSGYVGMSLGGLTAFYSEAMKGVGAGSRLLELLDRRPAIDADADAPGVRLAAPLRTIAFDGVGFHYPSRADATVLRGLSLEIAAGTHVAIAGPSGRGKSTLAALLLRFYDPTQGRVLVDGHDLRTLQLHAWRQRLALVPQEPALFAGSIRDNLLYGNAEATDAQLVDALRRADAWQFVERFPAQMDTYVGERGVALSGGQRQRVAIARALLRQPEVLVLDEATSALDGTREARVLAALHGEQARGARPMTVVTVAHRASTLRPARSTS
ncbi:ATP-binding cassette permease mdl1 [Coemansia interrupta]|uniref:ATP-binding cassette permease mdl1 n=1 Tax=Coemansia interrupta TaxID=1126814 RepID=A0A9W8LKJ8_9FUNG|nr:ATP-binding cassette permease mdl1 [Coemansia interrupta]